MSFYMELGAKNVRKIFTFQGILAINDKPFEVGDQWIHRTEGVMTLVGIHKGVLTSSNLDGKRIACSTSGFIRYADSIITSKDIPEDEKFEVEYRLWMKTLRANSRVEKVLTNGFYIGPGEFKAMNDLDVPTLFDDYERASARKRILPPERNLR
jgi:hypothetical protein